MTRKKRNNDNPTPPPPPQKKKKKHTHTHTQENLEMCQNDTDAPPSALNKRLDSGTFLG